MTQTCRECGKVRPANEKFWSLTPAGNLRRICRACYRKRAKSWYFTNSDHSKEKSYWSRVKHTYGVTREQVVDQLSKQDGKCAICEGDLSTTLRGTNKRPDVDHCHTTGRFRGLLCSRCNSGLGSFRDDPALLMKAVQYLGSPVR